MSAGPEREVLFVIFLKGISREIEHKAVSNFIIGCSELHHHEEGGEVTSKAQGEPSIYS